ncbi:shikimate dehydrogenase family protein [Hwanghaeella sp.]|uniref:shikimate dehydrogenase family protein n=1 Tax=Hwanghaeella sp. TaxID=2605943 RepID=UPI003CCBE984
MSQALKWDVTGTLEQARRDLKVAGMANQLLALMIGNPIAQVKAPAMLNPRFEADGIPVRMISIELPVDDFDAAYREALSFPDVVAAVITVPFKVPALKFCTTLDRNAELAGATNLMMRSRDGGWTGSMTDGQGFLTALKAAGFDPMGRRVYMAGAGGAGSGIAAALLLSGIAALDVYDPEEEKSKRLAAALGITCLAEPPGNLSGYDLLINATPLGLKERDPLPFDLSTAAPDAFVGDVIAEPECTRLRALAAQRGLKSIGGLDMLRRQIDALYQGVVKAVQDNIEGGKG